ncbi:MAG: hypothetical protein JSW47_01130, partial [Phycisphaerales bacterium]
MTESICYVICSTPRSGSHFYAASLAATGIAGRPEDHFNPWGAGGRRGEAHDAEPKYDRKYVADIMAASNMTNGIFGTTVQFNQIAGFVGFKTFEGMFPHALKYLYLTRRDILQQAVSLAIARQTGQFQSGQPPAKQAQYNEDQIRCCLDDIINQERGWTRYFSERSIEPFRVFYEDLVTDTRKVVLETLEYLNICIPSNLTI